MNDSPWLGMVRSLLRVSPQRLGMIQLHLGLSCRHNALEVMEALEQDGQVYCDSGVWKLINKCAHCDEPIYDWIDQVPCCVSHALIAKEGA